MLVLKPTPTLCYPDLPLLHRADSPPDDTKHWQRELQGSRYLESLACLVP